MPASIVLSCPVFIPRSPQAAPAAAVCAGASAAGSDYPAGSSPLEMTWRQIPQTMTRYLSVEGICRVSAVSTALRFVNAREVLPARLLGKRAENLRLATGAKFSSLVDRVAALTQTRSFRSAPISSIQTQYEPSRHGPACRREIRTGTQQFLPFGGSQVHSDMSACGRTQVLYRPDVAAVRIVRDGEVHVMILAQPCAHVKNLARVSPNGRICVALTGGVLSRLHKIFLDRAGNWHKAVYPLAGLDMAQMSGLEVTDSGAVFILTRADGQRRTALHRWQQERGLRSTELHVDGCQRIAAIARDGMTLVLQGVGAPGCDSFLLRFGAAGDAAHGGKAAGALPYSFRVLPQQHVRQWQGSIGDAAFSPDGGAAGRRCGRGRCTTGSSTAQIVLARCRRGVAIHCARSVDRYAGQRNRKGALRSGHTGQPGCQRVALPERRPDASADSPVMQGNAGVCTRDAFFAHRGCEGDQQGAGVCMHHGCREKEACCGKPAGYDKDENITPAR